MDSPRSGTGLRRLREPAFGRASLPADGKQDPGTGLADSDPDSDGLVDPELPLECPADPDPELQQLPWDLVLGLQLARERKHRLGALSGGERQLDAAGRPASERG